MLASYALLSNTNNGTNHGCGTGAKAILDGWSRSQKLSDGGAGARNLGSCSTDIVRETSELRK